MTGETNPHGKAILARLPDPRAPQFGATYAAMLAHKTRRAQFEAKLTVPQLCDLYEKSPRFEALADNSKKAYRTSLDKFQDQYTTAPAEALERRDIVLMLDKMANTPGAANLLLSIVSTLYEWGRKRGHVTNDPAKDVDSFKLGEHDPWPETLLEAALAADDAKVRLATHLLYYTALRIGDVCALRWTNIKAGMLTVTPRKTQKSRKDMTFPIHESLALELARHPHEPFAPILCRQDGKPYSQITVRGWLQAFAIERGVAIVPHGLRKNAVNSLLEAGCSVAQTASISGQSLQVVEHYAKKREQARLGSAAILQWETAGRTKPGQANSGKQP